jgi:hypothetical protein
MAIAIHNEWHMAASTELFPFAAIVLVDDLQVIHPYSSAVELKPYFVDPGSPEWRAALMYAEGAEIRVNRTIDKRERQRTDDLS